jgi:hypothetical protein
MNPQTSHDIKHRAEPKDVFYTPLSVAKKHISLIQAKADDVWYDPFAGKKVYYDNFPSERKEWAEITEGRDFFAEECFPDIICSNPPYSCIDEVLQRSVDLKPRIISYLLLEGKMTPKRIEFMNQNGYSLSGMYMCKVFSWYGMAVAYTFTQMENPDNLCKIEYDRIVHRS